MTSIKQVIDYLVDHRAAATEPASFSDVLEQLVWLIDDNGAGIHAVLEEWLVSAEDLFRVKVALGVEEVFLFGSRARMVEAFLRLESRWPELKGRCAEILGNWDRQQLGQ